MKRTRWVFLTPAALVLASGSFLFLLVDAKGVELAPDSRYYIAGGISLARGNGFAIQRYEVESDSITVERITAFPPGTSLVYALLILSGIETSRVPSVTSVVCWALFLAGVGLFSHSESKSEFVACCAIVLASFSVPFLEIYTHALSEVVFLPILIAALLVFVSVRKKKEVGIGLGVGTMLLTALVLTRYIGVFIYLAIAGWLSWCRLSQRQFGLWFKEMAVLSLPSVPFLLWIVWNAAVGGNPLGAEIGRRGYSFIQAQTAIIYSSTWLILPSIRPTHIDALAGRGFVLFYALPIALIGYTTWRYRRDRMGRPLLPPSTPLTVIGAAYLIPFAVWTLPFSNLMSTRFVVVLLCLAQIWSFALVSKTPPRFCQAVCSGYLALNVALFFLAYPVAKTEPPDHVLTSKPPRLRDLANYHTDLVEFLERTRPEVILTTRQAGWLFHADELGVPGSLEEWLSEGKCESIHDRVVVLLSDDVSSEPSRFDDEVRRKCALGPPVGFRGSRVFLMPATGPGPAGSAGTHHQRAAAGANDAAAD